MAGNELKFDLTRITAGEMGEFVAASARADTPKMAAIFAKTVAVCPWGPADDPNTYLALPFFGEWQQVFAGLTTAAKNAGPP